MKHFLIACCLAGSLCAQQQNLKDDYTPLTSQNPLPELFTAQLRPMAQKEAGDLKKLNKSANTDSLLYSYAGIETFVKSGDILVNDELSAYLGRMADVLLKDKPELRKSIHIYAYKSAIVNAHSFSQGCIFINTGMVAQAETEAQLAYLLAREIAHYTKKHSPGHRAQPSQLTDDVYTYGKSVDDELADLYAYSPADEADADAEAYSLYAQSGYNPKQAQKAFDLLQYAHLPFELVEFKKSFFESSNYKLPARYFLKEVSPIASKSNTNDLEAMHPDINRRKSAVERLIAANTAAGKSNYLVGEPAFSYARDLARFELCRLFLRTRDYPNALYASYILLQKYPGNAFLQETVSKCLYGVALFNKGDLWYTRQSAMSDGIKAYSDVESYPQQLYYLIKAMPANEWAFMSLNYVYRAHKRFPQNKALCQISDSLFAIVGKTEWNISDFVRTNVKDTAVDNSEPKSKTELIANIQKTKDRERLDTMYYKDVYLDLFMSDREFSGKFPQPPSTVVYKGQRGFKDYKKTPPVFLKTDTVIFAAPYNYYLSFNKGTEEVEPDFEPAEESLSKIIMTAAGKTKYPAVLADARVLGTSDADKQNDFSLINDWVVEKSDEKESRALILNTDQAAYLVKKYNTPYVLKMGFVMMHGRKGEIIFYMSLYDLNKSRLVYSRSEKLPSSSNYTLAMTPKVYQLLSELKYHKIPADE